ncbi:hypothetical protein [Gimesia fumaroli]|uniref:hypothetical protein n=1 Tax=Gimesia fumaroli TaxID=2527976 RepID=UPI0018D5B4C7|nr:hypothetical protein [Gimesia fumaroli]
MSWPCQTGSFGDQSFSTSSGTGKKILASQDPIFDAQKCGPQPGWYAISIHMLHAREGSNDYFLKYFKPVAMTGYSIYLYHITLEDANRVRDDLGLPLIDSE